MSTVSKARGRDASNQTTERLRRKLLEVQRDYLHGLESCRGSNDEALNSARSGVLKQIADALKSIEDGSYGVCENCGEAIAKARLQALPYASWCLTCKQKQEEQRFITPSACPNR